jgi:acetolactate synthase-1/2/3 large subunit
MANSRKTSAAHAVVEALKAEKVEYVFGLTGSHVLPIFDVLADVPEIRHVVVKHESNAAFMAGMYGYLTRQPGVALVTAGPGATNSISGVVQAYAQSMPMVHISGDVPLGSGNEGFHGVDREDFLHRMFADITKWSVRVERAEDIPEILSRAFALAVSGRPGPVHIDIPMNVVQAQDVEMPIYQSSPVEVPSPSAEVVAQVTQALKEAKRPMICVGRGVLVTRANKELAALAEAVSAPVLSSTWSIGAIAREHPLAAGVFSEWAGSAFAWELLEESDFLLGIGLRSNTSLTDSLKKYVPKNAILIASDDENTLKPTEGMTTVIASDSKLFLSELLTYVDEFKRPPDAALLDRIAQYKQTFQRGLALHLAPFESEPPLHFGRVLRELAAQMEQDAIVVAGVGNHSSWGRIMLPVQDHESLIREGAWCTMGSELAGGIAAKLVYPERQVVVITGDGSLLMSSPDYVTAVEAGANILVVVLNDSRYGMITAMQQRRFGRSFGDEIGGIDFARFAESFGATGIRVDAPGALPDAIAQSLSLSAGTPVLLDAVCDYKFDWPREEAILAMGQQAGA